MSGKPRGKPAAKPIAFQGARGAFSEEAARKLLGPRVAVLPCERFEDVFRSLQEGRAEGAVVPIENTRLIFENATPWGAIRLCTMRTLVSATMGSSKVCRWS